MKKPISLLQKISLALVSLLFFSCSHEPPPPNILFCIADDWGWPHAGAYGDPVMKTPAFDRLAEEGILFEHAYVSSPSCTPSRNAILTGQYHWRLKQGANLYGNLDVAIPVFPLLLEDAGYFIGHWRKCWGPGDITAGGYTDRYPGGPEFQGFKDFLDHRPPDQPFFFWLGSYDPHRGYVKGSGVESGMDLSAIPIPGFYPDDEVILSDIADYYFEVQRFDRDCKVAIALLDSIGELDQTLILMTGDNGFPFPRAKSNLYDLGVHQPLAVRWGDAIKPGRVVSDFVSFVDFAPTFLELAGVEVPDEFSGNSLANLFSSRKEGWIESGRDHVIVGKERHVPSQLAPSLDGYPCRSIRTKQYQYIHNFKPDRWPVGVPDGATHPMNSFTDCDGGPTKDFLIEHANDPGYESYFNWSFGKRPQEELYDMQADPDQMVNLAGREDYKEIQNDLRDRLFELLRQHDDPRVLGGGEAFDAYPYESGYALRKYH